MFIYTYAYIHIYIHAMYIAITNCSLDVSVKTAFIETPFGASI